MIVHGVVQIAVADMAVAVAICVAAASRFSVLRGNQTVVLGAARAVLSAMKEKEKIGRVHCAVSGVNCIQRT